MNLTHFNSKYYDNGDEYVNLNDYEVCNDDDDGDLHESVLHIEDPLPPHLAPLLHLHQAQPFPPSLSLHPSHCLARSETKHSLSLSTSLKLSLVFSAWHNSIFLVNSYTVP